MFRTLQGEIDAIIDNIIELSWFMRGGIPYEQMMLRTPGERQRINDFIVKRLESEGKRPHPVY